MPLLQAQLVAADAIGEPAPAWTVVSDVGEGNGFATHEAQ